jgi:hypothetical protein
MSANPSGLPIRLNQSLHSQEAAESSHQNSMNTTAAIPSSVLPQTL